MSSGKANLFKARCGDGFGCVRRIRGTGVWSVGQQGLPWNLQALQFPLDGIIKQQLERPE